MHYTIDLRFGVPPLVNILLYLLLGSDQASINLIRYWDNHLIWKVTLLILLLSLFLFLVSIKLPLTAIIIAEPIRFHFGDFRFYGILSIMLLGSFFFEPWLFWYTYLVFICISPFLDELYDMLQAIPTVFVIFTRTRQQQENAADDEALDQPSPGNELTEII